jgi:hypothetical protein
MNYFYDVHILTHCHVKSTIQQEENSFHQQIKLKFKEETSKLLHLEHSFYGAETLMLQKIDQKCM